MSAHDPKRKFTRRGHCDPLGLMLAVRRHYGPSGGNACKRASLWITMMPENGWSSSRIRKSAPETDSAQMTSDAKVVAFAGAIREKPANKIIIQTSSTAKKGTGIELPRCEKSRNRACIKSFVTWIIRA